MPEAPEDLVVTGGPFDLLIARRGRRVGILTTKGSKVVSEAWMPRERVAEFVNALLEVAR